MTHLAIVCAHISNYHEARFRYAATKFERLSVVTVAQKADFTEFLSNAKFQFDHYELNLDSTDIDNPAAISSAVNKSLGELQPDVIAVSGWAAPESLSTIYWAIKNRVPRIVLSASQERDASRQKIRELAKRLVVSTFQSALVGGRTQAEYVAKLGVSEDNIFLGYNSVDNMHFACSSQQQKSKFESGYIICSARFVTKKNLDTLIYAYNSAMNALEFTPQLLIVGDGPERERLESIVSDLQLTEKVLFPGFQDYNSLPRLYQDALFLVLPSKSEQWGLVINEACAAGIPIICSHACGAANHLLVDGENGYLVDPNSQESIRDAIIKLCSLDGQTYEAFCRKSRELVAAHGPDRFAEGLAYAADAALRSPPPPWHCSLVASLLARRLSQARIQRVL